MKVIKFLALLVLVLTRCDVSAQSFVQRSGHQFILNGKPYYFVGTNYWYGGYLGLAEDRKKGVERLRKELDFLKANGVTNLRVLTGVEGSGQIHGVQRVQPPLQSKRGVFDEKQLAGLDLLLTELNKRNMKAVLFLSNNWEWSGGFMQYVNWNGLMPDSTLRRRLSWDEQRDYTSKFYTCNNCIEDYLQQVNLIVNRTNKITNKKYINDPAIMAWELANEPRPMRPAADEAYKAWAKKTTALIKSLDKNHLVTLGHEGAMAVDDNMSLFEEVHADNNVDYLTIHIWPKNWGWFKEATMQQDYPAVRSKTIEYIDRHTVVARRLAKPLVVEEFGMPRDHHSFDINSTTTLRDNYYRTILNEWQRDKKTGDVIGGINFWAFGGTARPKPGQIFWKEGDDYMGDPPMEEQGLNAVFDSDASTWKMINTFTGAKAAITDADLPIDTKATKETVSLYHNLKRLLNKGVMFGHQDTEAYGFGWKYQAGRSDIKDMTGDYPAVYGYELGHLETDSPHNLDSVPFDRMKGFIRDAYHRGGIVTLSWHLNNPLTGKTSWDPAPGTVASILPGGSRHDLYKNWLDKVAAFVNDLKGKNGEFIPVLFRPFHELNGNWFWWGKNHCTPAEYKQMWHFTISYLRDEKQIHHLLYAFNTDRFASAEDYLERYPGDEWTDVIGFDVYQRENGEKANEQFIRETGRMMTTLERLAKDRNKIPAMTEFGYNQVPDSNWFNNVLLKALEGRRISYVLAWRNAGVKKDGVEFYVPYKGHSAEKGFIQFYTHPKTLFQKDISKENVYSKQATAPKSK